ncbi:angiopoietin-related protein 1-like isoform X2 [Teleopsis dalmanni]|uniref:angiopoietin-related protein 1-like isoform X2 n=1 Tax=Teleopsis dalmanni TaxID=139649 RepID=UPI0018CFB477|nr:angiopoietin-related protein 1-like isoform X2 [Teleopsis dalmanni]XP_037953335.1 angiopoietin-related protein 1-like isoform X2 [Teleopsis dalmanni]
MFKILYTFIFVIYLLEIGTAYSATKYKSTKTPTVDISYYQKNPTNCYEATGNTGKSGVYTLDIEGKSFLAYCEADINGGGWLVIQRRQDGTVDFNRNWTDYQSGFGNINGEFFFGLNKLHTLTNKTAHELMIVTRLFDSTVLDGKYDYFLVGSETEGYSLKKLGFPSGIITFSLGWNEGLKFWTKDRYNNSLCNKNLTEAISGGWWTNCLDHSFANTNLNGIYNREDNTNEDLSIGVDRNMTIKFVQMMIRPTGF